MATRRRRRWIGICGATAAVAIGAWAAVATGAPTSLTAPAVTRLPVQLTWAKDRPTEAATSYDVQRAPGACASPGAFGNVGSTAPGVTSATDTPTTNGTFCYRIVGHYAATATCRAERRSRSTTRRRPSSASRRRSPTRSSAARCPSRRPHPTPAVPASPAGSPAAWRSRSTAAPAPAASWNTATVADGLHTLTGTASDVAGNVGTVTISVTVDNTPPEAFAITAPSPVSGRPTLSWPAGPYTYTVRRDGGDAQTVELDPLDRPGEPGRRIAHLRRHCDRRRPEHAHGDRDRARDRGDRDAAALAHGALADQRGAASDVAEAVDVRRHALAGLARRRSRRNDQRPGHR